MSTSNSEPLTTETDLTPGPWVAMAPLPKSYSDHGYRIVCEVSRKGEKLHIYAEAAKMWREGEGYHWGQDDARLIAAAPDLLAALKELLASNLAIFPSFEAGKDAQDAWSDRRAKARNDATAAIDKAEGRS